MILSFIVCFCLIFSVLIINKYPLLCNSQRKGGQINVMICNQVPFLIVIIIFSVLLGFRYDVGIDYLAYKNLFIHDIQSSFADTQKNVDTEWLFTIISFIIKRIGGGYRSFFFVFAFIFSLFICLFLHREKKLAPWIIICMIFSGVLFWCLGFLRHGVAFSILLYATSLLTCGKTKAFIVLTLIAAGFHITSFLFLIILPFRKILFKAPSSRLLIIIFIAYILTYAFSVAIETFITDKLLNVALGETKFDKYGGAFVSWRIEVSGSGLGLLVRHVLDMCLILLTPILGQNKNKCFVYFYLFIFGSLLHNAFEFNVLLLRIPICFDFMFIVFASFIFNKAFTKWKGISLRYRCLTSIGLICLIARFIGELKDNPYSFFE